MEREDIPGEAARLRPTLLRFARLQLRTEAAAEDAVQETLLAAVSSGESFAGKAALRTWLMAILRNKIGSARHISDTRWLHFRTSG